MSDTWYDALRSSRSGEVEEARPTAPGASFRPHLYPVSDGGRKLAPAPRRDRTLGVEETSRAIEAAVLEQGGAPGPLSAGDNQLRSLIALQNTEISRLTRANDRLMDRVESLLNLQEREQVLRQQLQTQLAALQQQLGEVEVPSAEILAAMRGEIEGAITEQVAPVLLAMVEALERGQTGVPSAVPPAPPSNTEDIEPAAGACFAAAPICASAQILPITRDAPLERPAMEAPAQAADPAPGEAASEELRYLITDDLEADMAEAAQEGLAADATPVADQAPAADETPAADERIDADEELAADMEELRTTFGALPRILTTPVEELTGRKKGRARKERPAEGESAADRAKPAAATPQKVPSQRRTPPPGCPEDHETQSGPRLMSWTTMFN